MSATAGDGTDIPLAVGPAVWPPRGVCCLHRVLPHRFYSPLHRLWPYFQPGRERRIFGALQKVGIDHGTDADVGLKQAYVPYEDEWMAVAHLAPLVFDCRCWTSAALGGQGA